MRPQVGQVVNNKYRLLRLIGDGGMGAVYEARHEVLGTSVALKFLHAELGKRSGLVQRFLQEARVSAQIASPHVVRVTDVDQSPSGAFIVMEYIEGRTLQSLYEELYKAGQQLSQADAIEYAMQMLEGVEAAHHSGIVHRDLKPDNVMITLDSKGRPLIKLLDFGIAKLRVSAECEPGLTRPGVIMGTPEYMAPEQAFSADTVDARADIFSLGVMIFEMLAGRRPVGGEDPHQIAAAYYSGQIARLGDLAPDVPAPLAAAVHRSIEGAPADRWASVGDLRDAMQPYAAPPRPPTALPPGPSRVPVSAEALSIQAIASPVARTLPPASQLNAEGAARPSDRPDGGVDRASANGSHKDPPTNPADPPAMSDPPPRGPTPLGGFSDPDRASSGMGAKGSTSHPDIPVTRSALPVPSHIDATVPAPGYAGPYAAPVVSRHSHPAEAAHGLRTSHPSAHVDGTSPMAPDFVAQRMSAAPIRPPVVSAPRKPSTLSSLPAILLLAAGVSAAVVGGVYIAHNRAKSDDHEDRPPPPPTTVAADPPPAPDQPGPTAAPPPTIGRQIHPPQPFRPPPKGSAAPSAQPSASAPKPLFPLPVIIPSSFPIDLPFFPPSDEPPPAKPAPTPRRDGPSPRGERMMRGSLGRPRAYPMGPPPDLDIDRRPLWAPPPRFDGFPPAGLPISLDHAQRWVPPPRRSPPRWATSPPPFAGHAPALPPPAHAGLRQAGPDAAVRGPSAPPFAPPKL
jgi:serine/threonine-protein kinase